MLQCLLCRHINFVMVSYKRDITETKLNSNQLIYKSTLRRPHAKGTKWLVYMQRSSSLLLVKVSPKILRTQTRRSQTVLFTRSGSHRWSQLLFYDCDEPGKEVCCKNTRAWQLVVIRRASSLTITSKLNTALHINLRQQQFRDCDKPNKKVRLSQRSAHGKKQVSCT